MTYDTRTPEGLQKARETRLRHYRKYRQKYIQKSIEAKRDKMAYAQNIKATTPCTDCGVQYPHYVMEFDHCRGEKVNGVTALTSSWKTLLAEIEKCDVVCANCHAARTYMRIVARRETDSKPVLLGA